MRVLVCGGRDFNDSDFIWNKLYELNSSEGPFTCLIHGCAAGVDTQAKIWAETLKIPILGFRAEWQKYGNIAGPMRNGRMLRDGKPNLVIAFPGNRGTMNMKRQAREAGIRVIEITIS